MMNPLIDVLVPVYNGQSTIESSIGSILDQSVDSIVVHIVDDGSTDSTPDILQRLADRDSRIRIHRQANSGIVDALNFGLSFCTAKYVARHDADDLAYPTRFQIQIDYLENNPDCVAVGGVARHIDADGNLIGTLASLPPPRDADVEALPSIEPYIIHPFLMVRRDALAAVGGYRYVHNAEDTDLYWRLMSLGRLENLPDVIGEYRLHDQSISGTSIRNGRVMALSSQLAAVSELRRRNGRADLSFEKSKIARFKAALSLEELIEIVRPELVGDEQQRLEAQMAAKLMELTAYRPFELEAADCAFISRALKNYSVKIPRDNEVRLVRQVSGTAARLASGGQWASAFRIMQAKHLVPFAIRLFARLILPANFRRSLRSKIAISSPSK